MSHNDTADEQRNHTKGLRSLFCSASELDRSYKRCSLLEVSIGLATPRICLPEATCNACIETNWFLISVTERVIRPDVYTLPEQTCICVLCDSQLAVLKLFCVAGALSFASELGIARGALLTEESFGTNALALSKEHRRLVAVQGRHHYCHVLKGWSSVASPVNDPEGNILGYLALLTYQDNAFWFTSILLKLVILSMERELGIIHWHQNNYAASPSLFAPLNGMDQLTRREREVLQLRILGMGNNEIAHQLSLSVHTVATHCRNIYSKIDIKNHLKFIRNNNPDGIKKV